MPVGRRLASEYTCTSEKDQRLLGVSAAFRVTFLNLEEPLVRTSVTQAGGRLLGMFFFGLFVLVCPPSSPPPPPNPNNPSGCFRCSQVPVPRPGAKDPGGGRGCQNQWDPISG